jgi:hypothetical protein
MNQDKDGVPEDSVKITKVVKTESGFVTGRRLYETADGRCVEEGDPDAAFLLAPAGGFIDEATAERLGISERGIIVKAGEKVTYVPSSVAEKLPEAKPVAEEEDEEAEPKHRRTAKG